MIYIKKNIKYININDIINKNIINNIKKKK